MLDARTQGQVQDILHVLKKRRWQILLPALFVLSLGTAFATILPKKYNVEARMVVKPSRVEGDRELQNLGSAAGIREVQNAPELIRSYARVRELIELQSKTGLWDEWVPASDDEKDDIIDRVIQDLSVRVIAKGGKNSSIFVDVNYSDVDETRALRFLQAICEKWLRDVTDEDLDRLRNEYRALSNEVEEAKKLFSATNQEFSEHAKQIDRDPTELLTGGNSRNGLTADPVVQQLNELRRERDKLSMELSGSRNELELLELDLAREPLVVVEIEPVAGRSFEAQKAKLEEAHAGLEKKLAKLRPSHNKYGDYRDQLERLEAQIEELDRREVEVTRREVEKPNERRVELAQLVSDQKREVASLEAGVGDMDGRLRELEEESSERTNTYKILGSLKEELEQRSKNWNKLEGELQVKRSAVKRLEADAVRPPRFAKLPKLSSPATTPNPLLIIIGSFLFGGALGLGAAVLSEFGRNSYRTVSDLANVMTVPVLGAIEPIVTRAEIRQTQLRRAVVGFSTALLIGGLVWVTWMYYASPERLPVEIQDAIEDFRLTLR